MTALSTPVLHPAGSSPPTLHDPALQPIKTRRQRSTRILVVEDEPVTAEVFARALHNEGHRVRVARDGVQAAHALRDHPPDLVVLDMGLPGAPGSEVLRGLRQGPRGATVPVIVVSGVDRDQTSIEAGLLSPGLWVTKPVRPRDLVAAVRGLLEPPTERA